MGDDWDNGSVAQKSSGFGAVSLHFDDDFVTSIFSWQFVYYVFNQLFDQLMIVCWLWIS